MENKTKQKSIEIVQVECWDKYCLSIDGEFKGEFEGDDSNATFILDALNIPYTVRTIEDEDEANKFYGWDDE